MKTSNSKSVPCTNNPLRFCTKTFLPLAAALALFTTGHSVHAQSYSLDSATIQFSAGESAGGGFSVVGSLEMSSPEPSTGGGFSMSGAVTATLVVESSDSVPTLFIQGSAEGIVITWTDDTGSFTLEETDTLGSGEWTEIPSGNASPVIISPDVPTRFYRLRIKP